MASVQNAPRKTLSLPKSAANVRAALKAGTATSVRPPRTRSKPVENIWVTALVNAEGFHRDALQLELAVGLSLFADKADADKATLASKKALREVYASAGYACSSPTGEDYKTVVRRVNVAADLYVHLGGRETINDWIADVAPKEQVSTVMEHVKALKFDSIYSVLAYVGKPVVVKRPRAPKAPAAPSMSEADKRVAAAGDAAIAIRRAEEAAGARRAEDKLPPGRIFASGAVTVAIPFEASFDDVVAIANKLMDFAMTQMPHPVAA